jgi:hypothetical protein
MLHDTYNKLEYGKDLVPREENNDVFCPVFNPLGLNSTDESDTNADFDRIDPSDWDNLEGASPSGSRKPANIWTSNGRFPRRR